MLVCLSSFMSLAQGDDNGDGVLQQRNHKAVGCLCASLFFPNVSTRSSQRSFWGIRQAS